MALTEEQEAAVDMAVELAETRADVRIGIVSGYAGTGKTYVLRQIIEALGAEEPIILAPTGKAALRVTESTGIPALTFHRWRYYAVEDPKNGDVAFKPRVQAQLSVPDVPLLPFDEGSMVSQAMHGDACTGAKLVGANILYLADPFQLPPVTDDKDEPFSIFDLRGCQEVRLTQIQRQAMDGPGGRVIRASMLIREQSIRAGVAELDKVSADDFATTAAIIIEEGGVVICHKNETRLLLNRYLRSVYDHPPEAVPGEPLLFLKNRYGLLDVGGDMRDVYNGELGAFVRWIGQPEKRPANDFKRGVQCHVTFQRALVDVGVGRIRVVLCHEELRGEVGQAVKTMPGEFALRIAARHLPRDWKTKTVGFRAPTAGEEIDEDFPEVRYIVPYVSVSFGYVSTAHKAQGSEWPRVLVYLEQSIRPQSEEGRRWAYTAVTRAQEETLVALEGARLGPTRRVWPTFDASL